MKQGINPGESRIRASGRRIVSFKAVAILLPFLALLLLENSLRLFHYGHELGLFMEYSGDKRFLVLNPDASKRYFSDPSLAPTGNNELFKKVKDKNTCRIFVLGESTTIGYPYFHNGSFHRWLQYRLMRTFPDRNFEIINLSLTAVNSYTVLGFSKELVNYQPDAILIYCGQNEYYGAMGVGSANNFSRSRAIVDLILHLRGLRLTQLLSALYQKVARIFGNGKATAGETLMQRMAGDQQIAFGSKLYYEGIDQFRSNMDEVLALFNKYHIPVFLSNLVSNEKGLKPFVSVGPDTLRFQGFYKNFDLGLKAMKSNELSSAYGYFIDANRDYREHALCNYYLGQLSYEQGDYRRAEVFFSKARDLDGLRFRAPGQLNEIIDGLCNKYPNTHLVDTKAAFESHSDHGIIGDELILEHVHPNLKGYAIMADAFYRALKKGGIISAGSIREPEPQQLEEEMPITAVDSLAGAYRIARLKMSWPFREGGHVDSFRIGSGEEKLAYDLAFRHALWMETMETLYNLYISENNLEAAKKVMEAKVLERPTEPAYYERAANVYGRLNDYEHAAFYFRRAFDLAPSFEQARVLFVLYIDLDKPAYAMPYINFAAANSSDPRLNNIKKRLNEVINLEQQLARDTLDIPLLKRITDCYRDMGNEAMAVRYREKAALAGPEGKR